MNTIQVIVVTISGIRFLDEHENAGSLMLSQLVTQMGAQVVARCTLFGTRDQLAYELIGLTDSGKADLILTTGGTGLSPRDQTPEATRLIIHREMPGLAELIRSNGYHRSPFSVLSRGVAGIRGRTLVVNLPDSLIAIQESMDVLVPLLPTAIAHIKNESLTDGLPAHQQA